MTRSDQGAPSNIKSERLGEPAMERGVDLYRNTPALVRKNFRDMLKGERLGRNKNRQGSQGRRAGPGVMAPGGSVPGGIVTNETRCGRCKSNWREADLGNATAFQGESTRSSIALRSPARRKDVGNWGPRANAGFFGRPKSYVPYIGDSKKKEDVLGKGGLTGKKIKNRMVKVSLQRQQKRGKAPEVNIIVEIS